MEARSQLRHRPTKWLTLLAYHHHLRMREMCLANRSGAVVLLIATTLVFSSCTSRLRTIVRASHPTAQTLLTATKVELIKRLADNYAAVRSFSATVDLTTSIGSVNKGKIKDYTDITAYIDFRKPGDIRVVGILPVVHSTAFHMVADDEEFRVSIPVRGKFIQGRNDAPAVSLNKFENVRPQTFISGMLVKPINPETDMVVLQDDTTETNASYQLEIIRKSRDDIFIVRQITFDRVNLQITEQREYDESGSIVSLSKYDEFKVFDNVRFPSHIEISRPKDEYGIVLVVMKMEINNAIDSARFFLARPENSELQVIGGTPVAQPGTPSAATPK